MQQGGQKREVWSRGRWRETWRGEVFGVDGLQNTAPFAEEGHPLLVVAGEKREANGSARVSL